MTLNMKYNLLILKILIKQLKLLDKNANFILSVEDTQKANEYIRYFNTHKDKPFLPDKDIFEINSRVNCLFWDGTKKLSFPLPTFEELPISENLEDNFDVFDNFLRELTSLFNYYLENQEYLFSFNIFGQHPFSFYFRFDKDMKLIGFSNQREGFDAKKIYDKKVFDLLTAKVPNTKVHSILSESYPEDTTLENLSISIHYRTFQTSLSYSNQMLLALENMLENMDIKKYLLKCDKTIHTSIIKNKEILNSIGITNKITVSLEISIFDTYSVYKIMNISTENETLTEEKEFVLRKLIINTYKIGKILSLIDTNKNLFEDYILSPDCISILTTLEKTNNILILDLRYFDFDLSKILSEAINKDIETKVLTAPDLLNLFNSSKEPTTILKLVNLYRFIINQDIYAIKLEGVN